MYRIRQDKRILRSAQAIQEGMFRCLEHNLLSDISVSDIAKESGVSRATFYRLFDSPEDVLSYSCSACSREFALKLSKLPKTSTTRREHLLIALNILLTFAPLIRILLKNDRADLLLVPMMNDAELYLDDKYKKLPEEEKDYIQASSAAFLFSVLIVWNRHGQKLSAEELLDLHMRLYGRAKID